MHYCMGSSGCGLGADRGDASAKATCLELATSLGAREGIGEIGDSN